MSPLIRTFLGAAVTGFGALLGLLTLPFCLSAAGCGGAALVFYDSVHHDEILEIFTWLAVPSVCGSVVFLPLLVVGVVIVLAGPRARMLGVGGAADPENVFEPPRS
jgi:hypothetical protein